MTSSSKDTTRIRRSNSPSRSDTTGTERRSRLPGGRFERRYATFVGTPSPRRSALLPAPARRRTAPATTARTVFQSCHGAEYDCQTSSARATESGTSTAAERLVQRDVDHARRRHDPENVEHCARPRREPRRGALRPSMRRALRRRGRAACRSSRVRTRGSARSRSWPALRGSRRWDPPHRDPTRSSRSTRRTSRTSPPGNRIARTARGPVRNAHD